MRISDWSSDVCSSDPDVIIGGSVEGDVERGPGAGVQGLQPIGMFLEKRIASFRGMHVVAVERLDQRVPWQLEPLFHRRDALVSVDQRVLGGRDLGIGEYFGIDDQIGRSEEHTSEIQSPMRISYA